MSQFELLKHLKHQSLWRHFVAISEIPRCSKQEDRVKSYVQDFARSRNLEHRTDSAGNIIIKKPAHVSVSTDKPGVCLQGHLDMICEKNLGTEHDFNTDPLKLKLDGPWLSAEGTTLGADNGIAVAYMLSLLESDEPLGPLECLFTVDEETGLTGALGLDPSLVSSRMLINLDSEEEGFICIGCAGGRNTYGALPLAWTLPQDKHDIALRVKVFGLRGGHSGAEIHLGLGNSLVLGARFLQALQAELDMDLAAVWGGGKHNAIPREFTVDLLLAAADRPRLETTVSRMLTVFREELGSLEPNLDILVEDISEKPSRVMNRESATTVIALLNALPHGVLGMSRDVEGLVETSTNLAAVRIEEGKLSILTSQRSSRASLIDRAARQVGTIVALAGGTYREAEGYPSWPPNPSSALLKTTEEVFRRSLGDAVEVGAFHAGLECGVIGAKIDGMDMVSFGPTLEGVHTPHERMNVASSERTFDVLVDILRSL